MQMVPVVGTHICADLISVGWEMYIDLRDVDSHI